MLFYLPPYQPRIRLSVCLPLLCMLAAKYAQDQLRIHAWVADACDGIMVTPAQLKTERSSIIINNNNKKNPDSSKHGLPSGT